METAINLARTLETPAPAPIKTGQSTSTDGNRPDIMPRGNIGSSNTWSPKEPPHRPSTTAMTSTDTPAHLPSAGTSTRAAAHIEPDPEILVQLRIAASDERELQIISATIEV